MAILDLLIEKGIIKKDDAKFAEKKAQETGDSVEKILEEMGVPQETTLRIKGEYYNIPIISLSNQNIPLSVLKYISEDAVTHYKIAPLFLKEGVLEVGVVDPDNMEARDALIFITGKLNLPFKIFLISENDFNKVLESYKGLSGEVTKALSELETDLSSDLKEIEFSKSGDSSKTETKIIEDAPVTKIVATILRYAAEGNASDVHIEHMANKVRVRFRVDGILHTSLILPIEVHQAVVARIKILSNMKLDEKRKPQDGRFSAKIDSRKIDFRVSTFPAYYGEKVVMRILDQQKVFKHSKKQVFQKKI
jgi:type IV pilus assembly protein PilB